METAPVAALAGAADLRNRAHSENFPVALRILPARVRRHLMALYTFARLVDDAGDIATGDREAVLNAIETHLRTLYEEPSARGDLAVAIREYAIPIDPFLRLIGANRQDQSVSRYARFGDLLEYCELSAAPVGELVLHLFGKASPANRSLSARICAGLQILEHCQDIGEDFDAGRIYLPEEDLRRFGVFEFELGAGEASPAVRDLVGFEVQRARALIEDGSRLVSSLRGPGRLAVAAYAGSGLAGLEAVERADPLAGTPRASVPSRARHTLALLRDRRPKAEPVRAAYAECLAITRREARNFSFGIRLLPREPRAGLAAVYALARRIDDLADDTPDRPAGTGDRLAALEALRASIEDLPATGGGEDPVLVAVADAASRYPLPLPAFGELIDGVERDVAHIPFDTYLDLTRYCRQVAGSIGRLSLAFFGAEATERATGLADDLGIAFQLTNILRDVAEDRAAGRVYLPAADLARAGLGPRLEGPPEALVEVVEEFAVHAEGWYTSGLQLLDLLAAPARACVETMAGIYHGLLATIAGNPAAVLERRVSLPPWQKGLLAARAMARTARREAA